MKWKGIAIALLVVAGGFFEQGCSIRGSAAELTEGALEKGKEWVKNEIAAAAPALEAKVLDFAEKKLAEREAKDLATVDAQLVLLGSIDSVTGLMTAKTWRDFDADHDNHLSSGEVLKVGAYVSAEGFKRVQSGAMSKDTFLGMESKLGIAGASLVAGGVATAAVSNRKKKPGAEPAPKPAAAAPPPPPVPKPA